MKILLVGDLSGVHLTLKLALEGMGHKVTLLSDGDAWRKRETDIFLKPMISYGDKLKNYLPNLFTLKSVFKQKFDIVQIIHPSAISRLFFPQFREFLLNNKFFVISCGDDIFNYKNENFKSYYQSLMKYDNQTRPDLQDNSSHYEMQKFLYENAQGVIPTNNTYFQACKSYIGPVKIKIIEPIQLPYNTSKIDIANAFNTPIKDLNFWHGLNRVGAKGTYFFEDAFKSATLKYPNSNFTIQGRIPYDEFINLMQNVHVYADQVFFSDGYGYATVIALAQGKLVLGANGKEIAKLLNLDYELPIFRAPNNVDEILNSIDYIMSNTDKLPMWSQNAIRFVKEVHDDNKIAKQLIEIWNN